MLVSQQKKQQCQFLGPLNIEPRKEVQKWLSISANFRAKSSIDHLFQIYLKTGLYIRID